jgi:hypothetical protein
VTIPFTQYRLPHGSRVEIEIGRPGDIEEIAHRFIASGGRYECEILTTNEASITAVKKVDGEEQDVAIAVGPNTLGTVGGLVDQVVLESERFIEVAA